MPRFVERELRVFLHCGILAHGFGRVHCGVRARSRGRLLVQRPRLLPVLRAAGPSTATSSGSTRAPRRAEQRAVREPEHARDGPVSRDLELEGVQRRQVSGRRDPRNLYGTTTDGGASNIGTIYQIDALGDYTLVHSFTPAAQDGAAPRPLVLADDGNLYGVAAAGGNGSGTVFRFTPGSSGVTVLHDFALNGSDGSGPTTLVKGLDGNFYGTTGTGGTFGVGTVFRITTSGDFESLHSFKTGSGEANFPVGLTVGSDGNLYGTSGGGQGIGTVFRIRPNGAFTTLFAFDVFAAVVASSPQGALAQLGDTLYGTTSQGGAGGKGTVFRIDGLTIAAPEPEAAAGEAVAALCLGLFVARRQREARR